MKKTFKTTLLLGVAFIFIALIVTGCSQTETNVSDENSTEDITKSARESTTDDNNYPTDTIEVVVPAGPGGDTDINARTLAKYLSEELGVNMVVSNISGAGGTTGAQEVLKADPDGSKVLFHHNGFLLNNILGLADYTHSDFEVAGIAVLDEGNGFFVNAESEYEDLSDLIEAAKANPGKISIGTEVGSFTHLQLLAFQENTGTELNIVDAGGAADKIVALQGGHIEYYAHSIRVSQTVY
ncbi:tripartite-type tricarboxylate transporter receptor subunit TctC [Caldalkalibacillus uzonensis]|uniref:Tripartite-type tricarboxylate transporter receptor subunit TctC n=1 Tax=Caldalkalibacillus uzonensis TaxID=353224 RepID=A0ABU0CNX2_9BACI|nr:tripartite tricarboxylate transporter substrate binding protein [Caldalkalibacillus uzonensis]MDQ0338111.1 tripartite-type tricarboxylate transporter receptor subunit TctC [Caldalkalibacillus uzonensis]